MKSSFFCLQEVILHRSVEHQKLGLTLCYGSLEDETTDIFISEVSGPQIPTLSEKLAYCMIEARLECSIIGPQHNLVVTLFTLSFSYFHGVGGSSTTLGISYFHGVGVSINDPWGSNVQLIASCTPPSNSKQSIAK